MQRSRKALLERRAIQEATSGRNYLYKVSLSLVFVLWGLVFLFSLCISHGHGYGDHESREVPVGVSNWNEDEHRQCKNSNSADEYLTKETDDVYIPSETFSSDGAKTDGLISESLSSGESINRVEPGDKESSISPDTEEHEVERSESAVKHQNDVQKYNHLSQAMPLGLDEFKSRAIGSKIKSGTNPSGSVIHRLEPGGAEYNYASASKGAKVLASNKEARGASDILSRNKDKYLRNPCSSEEKFVVIELSEETLVKTIEIANFEHHSSNFKEFELYGSLVYPTEAWIFLGNFTASNVKQAQRFVLEEQKWMRYIKLNLQSHYGSEFYCTLSIVEVYGVDAIERMLEDLIYAQDKPFASGEGNGEKRVASPLVNAAEADNVRQNTITGINSDPASEISSENPEAINVKRNVPDPVEEIRQQVGRMPGDTVLKILMQKVRYLDLNLSVLEQYMEDLNSRYINIFKEYNKDMGEKDLLLEKIKEEIRRFLERQDVMMKEFRDLDSWKSHFSVQLDQVLRDNAVLRSEVEKVRENQVSLENKGAAVFSVKYVVKLARALANTKGIYRVDLLTRQIASPVEVDFGYGEPIEMLSCPSDGSDCGEAYIIRLPCGHRTYQKNHFGLTCLNLWMALSHIVNMARVLGEQVNGGKPTWPYVIHGHYADAGEVAAHLLGALNVPMVLTGHSLGRNKFEQLLMRGRLSREAINATYKIMRRIEAEELGVDATEMVVTSTRQEIEEQWGLYDGFDLKFERKLRVRRRRRVSFLGRHMSRMVVIPPGMDFSYAITQESVEGEGDLNSHSLDLTELKAKGTCLQFGLRDDIEEMSNNSSAVLTMVLKLIDKYDLSQLCEKYENYMTFLVPPTLQAVAYGLPVVATKNRGPVDILKALNNGLLIDPHDHKSIEEALLKLVADKNIWLECRKNGLKNIHRFSWPEHCRNYLSHVEFSTEGDSKLNGEMDPVARQKQIIEAIMCRVSSTGNSNASCYFPGRRQRLVMVAADCYDSDGNIAEEAFQAVVINVMKVVRPGIRSGKVGVMLQTGLSFQETIEALNNFQVNMEEFDVVVCNGGSEMYYPWKDLMAYTDYEAYAEYAWPGENIRSTIPRFAKVDDGEENDIVEYASACSSRCYSYNVKPGAMIQKIDELRQRYLSVKWGIDLSKVVVFVGEKGDTDYEELVSGIQKTLVLKGAVEYGSERLLRSEESYKREDVLSQDSPNIIYAEKSYEDCVIFQQFWSISKYHDFCFGNYF
ncbi:hypothetical protein JHK86_009690 [Glycine max]|nr:hypothetical protein JHK86_009690 [Glycine max]